MFQLSRSNDLWEHQHYIDDKDDILGQPTAGQNVAEKIWELAREIPRERGLRHPGFDPFLVKKVFF